MVLVAASQSTPRSVPYIMKSEIRHNICQQGISWVHKSYPHAALIHTLPETRFWYGSSYRHHEKGSVDGVITGLIQVAVL